MIRLKKLLKENMKRFGTKNLNEYEEDEFDRSPEMYKGGKSPREGQDYDIHINHAVVTIGNSDLTYSVRGKLDADVIDEILSDIDAYDDSGRNSVRLDCELKTAKGSIDMSITYAADGDLEDVDLYDRELAAQQGITELDIIDYLNDLF
jgi:hypothetical protein